MNVSSFQGTGRPGKSHSARTIYAGGQSPMQGASLKSTREKIQRRQKADGQVAFWEKKKESLKSMECGSLEEIARKLEMFHTYEDEIAAAKASYNNEQMFHILDEAMEQGKKNAQAAEKTKPKTPEERKEELVEEALGIDEEKGVLSEVLDEVMEEAVEAAGEMAEKANELAKENIEKVQESAGNADITAESPIQDLDGGQEKLYKRFDMRI